MFDLIIIGGGPAGVSAGIYAVRKKLKTLVVAEKLAGQSTVSHEIQNWIGEKSISGMDLAKKLEDHLRSYEGPDLTIKISEKVASVEKVDSTRSTGSGQANFTVKTDKGEYETKTVLITAGATRRKLTVKGADVFEQKGVTYCASCDGPMFSGQNVVVIGGGNAGFNSAAQLLAYCESVTLLEMTPTFRAEQITIDKLLQNPKFKAINNVELIEIKGSKFVNELVYKIKNFDGTTSSSTSSLQVTGIFVEIGFVANTEIYKDIVKLNAKSEIVVDHLTQKTSQEGIWSAGDCTDILYRQNNIAAGDAANAVEDIYNFLQKK